MKTRIVVITIAALLGVSILHPDNNHAQTEPPLGQSCNNLPYKRLRIPKIEQQYSSWCWAAVAQNIMASHKPELSDPTTPTGRQCNMVKTVIKNALAQDLDCCADTPNECMSRNGWPEDVFDDHTYGFSYQPSRDQWVKLDWTAVTEEICQNRPIYSAIDFLFGGNHVVVVSGYRIRRGLREIKVYDPIDDSHSFQSYDLFVQNPNYRHLGDIFQIKPY